MCNSPLPDRAALDPSESVIHRADGCTWTGLPELADLYRLSERSRGHRTRRVVTRGEMLTSLALYAPSGHAIVTAHGPVVRQRIHIPGHKPLERRYKPTG